MKRHAGFSLLELLAVVLIIGLVLEAADFSQGNNKPQELRNNARDFANYTTQVEDEAVLGREAWGVQIYRESVDENGAERIAYRFMHFTDRGWIAEAPRDIPVTARFAENVAAILTVDGAEQAIEVLPADKVSADREAADKVSSDKQSSSKSSKEKASQDKSMVPTIWLAPGGEVTPFELQLRFVGESEGPIVRSDALGRIELDIEQNEKL